MTEHNAMEPVLKAEYMRGVVDECKRIKELIVKEILICHHENTPTSRLTSLMNAIEKGPEV
jgi:hypothetical protein